MRIIKDISLAVQAFLSGKIGVFPTDTVWGVGCVLNNKEAIKRLYKIKKRDFKKPTAVLVADLKQAKKLGKFSEETERLAKRYWPGALTLVVLAENVGTPRHGGARSLDFARDDKGGIGLRVPDHDFLLKVLKKTGSIMATSANFAGEKAPTKKEEIGKKFLEKVDFLIEGKEPKERQASTVVDTTTAPFKILRQGSVVI